jgi:rSAM/selenodomain-associated transferase 1
MPTLLVFLKYPTPGKVKTRLAARVGDQRAAESYREWIGLVLHQAQPFREKGRIIGFYDGGSRDDFAPWQSLVDDWWEQPAGNLGERLRTGFEAALSRRDSVAAIGTDCLEVDALLLDAAFEVLIEKDAVFGPALDGGYYLVGTARDLPGFFSGIPWSSSKTMDAHLAHCQSNGWSVGLLPARRDIDTWEDWLQHCAERDSRP